MRGGFDCCLSEEMARGWGVSPLFPVLLFHPFPSQHWPGEVGTPAAVALGNSPAPDACAFLTSAEGRASAGVTSLGADISLLS